jgi:hypothetical protein
MAVKTITTQEGRVIRFGRKRPPVLPVTGVLRLGKFLSPLLVPPTSVDYRPDAAAALSQMYLNDKLGDCVCAGIGHIEGVLTGNEPAASLIFTDAQIEALYSGACGYVPGQPNTDNGCDIAPTLQYWMAHGAPVGSTHKPAGFISVNPENQTEVELAIWLFENVIPGIELPDAWVNPFPGPGFVWKKAGAPDPNNGHCPPGISYNPQGMIISTWGMTGTMEWDAVAYYCAAAQGGELYTVISQDALNAASGLAPAGVDWAQLVADFNALGGNLSPPVPTNVARRHHHHNKKTT